MCSPAMLVYHDCPFKIFILGNYESLLRNSMVYYWNNPIGTIVANDPISSSVLNYDQVFIRDFIVYAFWDSFSLETTLTLVHYVARQDRKRLSILFLKFPCTKLFAEANNFCCRKVCCLSCRR